MKTDIKKIGECKRLLKIELPRNVVHEKFTEVYAEIKAKASIPGFRVGKAPQDLLERYYNKTAINEVTQRLISESLEMAIKDINLTPIGLPQIKDVKLEGKSAFSFKAEIEIRPQVKLKNYKNLKVKRKKVEVSNKDVQEALLHLQQMNAQLHPVTGRVAQKGDWLLCDCKSFKGDNQVEEKENVWIALEEAKNSKEFVEGLVGASTGETKTIKEKEIIYSIRIKEIKEKSLRALDDSFAQDVGKCKNLAELKELIRNDLIRRNEVRVKLDVKNQILEQLLKNNVFSCPSSLIENELKHLVNEAKLRLVYQGVDKEEIISQEERMKDELREEAERRVRLSFILDKIAREEEIYVSPKELENELKLIEEKTEQNINLQQKDLIDSLRFQLREEKTINFLLQEAKISEVNDYKP